MTKIIMSVKNGYVSNLYNKKVLKINFFCIQASVCTSKLLKSNCPSEQLSESKCLRANVCEQMSSDPEN